MDCDSQDICISKESNSRSICTKSEILGFESFDDFICARFSVPGAHAWIKPEDRSQCPQNTLNRVRRIETMTR